MAKALVEWGTKFKYGLIGAGILLLIIIVVGLSLYFHTDLELVTPSPVSELPDLRNKNITAVQDAPKLGGPCLVKIDGENYKLELAAVYELKKINELSPGYRIKKQMTDEKTGKLVLFIEKINPPSPAKETPKAASPDEAEKTEATNDEMTEESKNTPPPKSQPSTSGTITKKKTYPGKVAWPQ